MFNSLCVVTVNNFTNGALDKNGKQPIILTIIAGKSPNRNVLSGTVAENAGFEVGKSYLANVREIESNKYGRQFVWTKVKEVSAMEIIEISDKHKAEVFDVTAKEENNSALEEEIKAEEKALTNK